MSGTSCSANKATVPAPNQIGFGKHTQSQAGKAGMGQFF